MTSSPDFVSPVYPKSSSSGDNHKGVSSAQRKKSGRYSRLAFSASFPVVHSIDSSVSGPTLVTLVTHVPLFFCSMFCMCRLCVRDSSEFLFTFLIVVASRFPDRANYSIQLSWNAVLVDAAVLRKVR